MFLSHFHQGPNSQRPGLVLSSSGSVKVRLQGEVLQHLQGPGQNNMSWVVCFKELEAAELPFHLHYVWELIQRNLI